MNEEFYINSIYTATEGEGIRIGTPQIFVRFQGCAVGCLNCDSKDTWAFKKEFKTPKEDLFEHILKLSKHCNDLKKLSITGGDPLHPQHHKPLREMIAFFKKHDFYINIEASGNIVEHEVFDSVDFISFDCKTPSTGVETPLSMLQEMADHYHQKCQFKSVIQHWKDYEFVKNLRSSLKDPHKVAWSLTPCFSKEQSHFDVPFICELQRENEKLGGPFRIITQQHKWLYGSRRTNV